MRLFRECALFDTFMLYLNGDCMWVCLCLCFYLDFTVLGWFIIYGLVYCRVDDRVIY
ncbi:hypothetical protein FA15DRAFT_456012 [Coprinopsis marcescibilis]|uniref:Uncharacterized protein n=1 Tax=Coprinopsis marcescibilis TaxID=230819 RepID=A0A5C3L7J5_COPMA|nr:hypothetical protein FA15DRAFT_456012 [Coprinopsis marcescibilis]